MTKSGTAPKQGDIVPMPVPFTDLGSSKCRPVLVLSSGTHNRRSPDIVVAAITSNPATRGGILITKDDLASGCLPAKSYIRPGNVYTLIKDIIVKHVGAVQATILQTVFARLDALLGRSRR